MTLAQKQPKNMYIWGEWTPISTPWIYRSEYLWLISISTDWTTWTTISDKNLWASKAYNFWDALNEWNCWYYYQRWNNYWFPRSEYAVLTKSSTAVNASTYWPWNYYSSSTWITLGSWDSSNNDNLWGNTTGTVEARQWPCSSWFHIRTLSEFNSFNSLITSLWLESRWATYAAFFKIPHSWYRNTDWTVKSHGTDTRLWTTSPIYTSYVSYVRMSDGVQSSDWTSRWIWASIRPVKNVWVQPDSSREKLV